MTSQQEKELNDKKIAYTVLFVAFVLQTYNFAITGSDFHRYSIELHFISGIIIMIGDYLLEQKQDFNAKIACICVYPFFFFPLSWLAIFGFGFIAFFIAKLLGRA